jgi:hypothetical protein
MQAQKPLRWAVALLLLAGCDRVIGLRSDYFLTAETAGVSGQSFGGESAGADNAGGTNAVGGSLDANGGSAGVSGSSETSGGNSTAMGGGGAAIGDAGASAGGAAGKLLCVDFPITAEAGWVVSASPDDPKYPPSAVTDGASTRWSTGHAQGGGEWLQIDFGETVSVRRVNLQQGSLYSNDYPRMYEVFVSDTDENLTGSVLASGVGTSGVTTTIVLPEVFSGRYLLIEQVDTSLSWWSVEEVEVSCYN